MSESVAELRLAPGDFYFGPTWVAPRRNPVDIRSEIQAPVDRVRTLLGSCVAITVWNPRAQLGGMCHYLLPDRAAGSQHGISSARGLADRPQPLDGRYADEAMTLFLQAMLARCTPPQTYRVGLFGGGNQFGQDGVARSITIPQRNISSGYNLTRALGMTIDHCDVGSEVARDVCLDLNSGEVTVRRVGRPDCGDPIGGGRG